MVYVDSEGGGDFSNPFVIKDQMKGRFLVTNSPDRPKRADWEREVCCPYTGARLQYLAYESTLGELV